MSRTRMVRVKPCWLATAGSRQLKRLRRRTQPPEQTTFVVDRPCGNNGSPVSWFRPDRRLSCRREMCLVSQLSSSAGARCQGTADTRLESQVSPADLSGALRRRRQLRGQG